ncbi:hypothetical protein [Crenalkalicoccus roseus]
MTDTDGRLLEVQVHAGSVQDRNGATPLLRFDQLRKKTPYLFCVLAL